MTVISQGEESKLAGKFYDVFKDNNVVINVQHLFITSMPMKQIRFWKV